MTSSNDEREPRREEPRHTEATLRCTIVSHTHWDREWYRSFESFRARLIDTVDRVLDLVEQDPDYHFQLDGQCIAVEDYLALRPERREVLEQACHSGRIALGPWYVQPDSLLPAGETHIRNLMEGRRIAEQFGSSCGQAYTPDSFGHPAQFPQLFAGFGLEPFIYWRGNGDEIESLGNEYLWRSPDGSAIRACFLAKGYFNAWGLSADVDSAANRLEKLAIELAETSRGNAVLLMNGLDHMLPDENTREVAEALIKKTGWEVKRGLLGDFVADIDVESLPEFEGELIGAKRAPLLPGVWSTRMPLKLANRQCEASLSGWAEPWSALAHILGACDERPALQIAWRRLLANQAHDSICGCSKDLVHDQMETRYEESFELAEETTRRGLERVAGLGPRRQAEKPSAEEPLAIAVFNPSPHRRSQLVRLPLEGFPSFTSAGMAPLLEANLRSEGFEVDGRPARLIPVEQTVRPRIFPEHPVYDLEFMAEDIPAMGWKQVALARSAAHQDQVDEGRSIEADAISVQADDDGTLTVQLGDRVYEGIAALEDLGDRGDSYDFDPVPGEPAFRPRKPARVSIRRVRHEMGLQELEIVREFDLPAELADDRATRSRETTSNKVTTWVRVQAGVPRVDLRLRIENRARDHRLRMLFPTTEKGLKESDGHREFFAATTFDIARRTTTPRDTREWIQPGPTTFPHQGWVKVDQLSVIAPGLPEAELSTEGVLAMTLVRSVGWLSRPDLESRPGEAGPCLATPGAQVERDFEANLCLSAEPIESVSNLARDFELGLRAVAAGPERLFPPGRDLLRLAPSPLVLSALKPSQDGTGIVLRVLNPTDMATTAQISLGFDCESAQALRLDESPSPDALRTSARTIEFDVGPHALRSVLLSPSSPLDMTDRDDKDSAAE